MKRRVKPTAIFVCNGVMTLGVLQAFQEMEIACPRDIALATFDEVAADHAFHPHVTAVVQPSYEMGSRAATMLMDRIEGRLGKSWLVVRVAPKLELRASSALPLTPLNRRS